MNLKVITSIALCFLTFATLCQTQIAEKLTTHNPCTSRQSCGECIQTKSCAWCFQPEYGDRPRCFQPSFLSAVDHACREEYTWNPDSIVNLVDHKALTKGFGGAASGSASGSNEGSSGSSGGAGSGAGSGQANVVQISPQRVNLNLRMNEAKRIEFSYSQAEDYPVDLYYLMDLSRSMKDDKDQLVALGDLLSDSMKKITSNFKLGFGSFVDKVVMPFVSTIPEKLKEPCEGCAAPYGFHNQMPLSTDTYHFSEAVRRSSVSGNLDAIEGGFDAIMQAGVCRSHIGWREQARRLLVFSTDAGFHFAGDGKIGGIIEPNDGLCHLNNQGTYTHSKVQDYPSVSQINLMVKQNAINLIFAVTSENIHIYESLQKNIEGSSCGVLSNDSSNVVDLVRDQYNKITSSVEMRDTSSSAVKITYYSACLNGGSPVPTNRCDGLKVGDVVTFTADIVVTECPKDPAEWNQVFHIYPVGINESMVVNLQMLCDCPCENPPHPMYQIKSERCSLAGTYKCGICECDINHFGKNCECNQGENKIKPGKDACRPSNATRDALQCNGRGNCYCGQCKCEERTNKNERIWGEFCQCDNFSCDRRNGLLCSDNGRCECNGNCICNVGWTGKSCDCLVSKDTCIPPGGGEVCSGQGECVCGQCKCKVDEERKYIGQFCDKCPTCPGRCAEFKECVQCKMYKKGPLTEEECTKNCSFIPIGVEEVVADEEKGEHLCAYIDEDNCDYAYVYSYDENNHVLIRAQQTPNCTVVYVPGIIMGVIAAILLIGMAVLMVWKMITTIHDRREFARYEKERAMAKWDTGENPIYRQATSTFKNPTYAGK